MPRGTTPFPNVLLDKVRPELKGSEWNVLCLIVRQTYGWSDGQGGRKQEDWLSHRQLKERTGLASASICSAIDTLVRRNIVQVHDGSGNLLETSKERRRHAGPLYFKLGIPCSSKSAARPAANKTQQGTPRSEAFPVGLSQTLQVEAQEIFGQSRVDHEQTTGNQSDTRALASSTLPSSAFQKMKTTKERVLNPLVDCNNQKGPEVAFAKYEKHEFTDLNSEVVNLLKHYKKEFRAYVGSQHIPTVHQDTLQSLQSLAEQFGPDNLRLLLSRFLQSDYDFIIRQGYSLEAFCNSVNLLHWSQPRKHLKFEGRNEVPISPAKDTGQGLHAYHN